MLFPDPGMPVAGGKTVSRDELDESSSDGTGFFVWRLQGPAEFIPGKWVFELWLDDKKLDEESFIVVLPKTS